MILIHVLCAVFCDIAFYLVVVCLQKILPRKSRRMLCTNDCPFQRQKMAFRRSKV